MLPPAASPPLSRAVPLGLLAVLVLTAVGCGGCCAGCGGNVSTTGTGGGAVTVGPETFTPPPAPTATFETVGPVQFAVVPAGQVLLGSGPDEKRFDRSEDEVLTEFRVDRPFLLSRDEVTAGNFARVMGGPAPADPDVPAGGVTFEEAREFCRRFGQEHGVFARLPTEAEWEYACRAGRATPFSPWPETLRGAADRYPADAKKLPRLLKRTVVFSPRRLDAADSAEPAGRPDAVENAWGLRDMHGNVAEWCESDEDLVANLSEPMEDWAKRVKFQTRPVRGGGYTSRLSDCRSAARGWQSISQTAGSIGFRMLVEPAPRTL